MPLEENYQTQPVEVISEESLPYEPIEEVIEEPQEAIPQLPVYEITEFYFSNDFYNRVNSFRDQNIVAYFLMLFNSRAVLAKTRDFVNYLGISNDDATKVSYLDGNKIFRRLSEGVGMYEDPSTRYHASAAKTIRKVLGCFYMRDILNYPYVLSDMKSYYTNRNLEVPLDFEEKTTVLDLVLERDIDDFNNRYRLEGFKQLDSVDVQIVKGHLIKHFYHDINYAGKSGNLSDSCMRYSHCQNYLNIYVENPSLCSLAVIVDSRGKLQARSILWTIEGQVYFDRIYSASDLIADKMRSEFLVKGYEDCYRTNRSLEIENYFNHKELNKSINLEFNKYPYMDSFKYLLPDFSRLSTQPFDEEDNYYILNRTSGDYEEHASHCEEDHVCCNQCGREVHVDDSCYIDLRGDENRDENLCEDCAVYSDYHGTFITRDESVDTLDHGIVHCSVAVTLRSGDYYLADETVQLADGTYCLEDAAEETVDGDYVLLGEPGFEDWVMCKDDRIRLLEDCVETKDGDYILAENSVEHEGEIWDKDELDVHLANLSII
jgi:hypothetical protein